MTEAILFAPAKVNLTLRILGKDGQGYHNLQSLVGFTDFGDELHIEIAGADEIIWRADLSWIGEAPPNNILSTVLAEVRKIVDVPYLRIMLVKKIPMGAGLGGGSADAACLLRYCIGHYNLPYDEAMRIAKKLGSDIVVCMASRAAWISGRGNDVMALQEFPKVHCLLVGGLGGRQGLSTADVFTNFNSAYSQECDVVNGFSSYDDLLNFLTWHGGNDLWDSATYFCKKLLEVRDNLLRVADYVSMSGSGSVLFGLFKDSESCQSASKEIIHETMPCRLTFQNLLPQ